MNFAKWFSNHSLETKGLYYKLSIIFSLFFLAPIGGFMYFAVKYDILNDEYIPIYFIDIFSFFHFSASSCCARCSIRSLVYHGDMSQTVNSH